MTTEMGESLCYSWLKHIKGCQIVQTNWKASRNWDHDDLDLNILDNARNWFKEEKDEDFVFKKSNYRSESILKTTECDVLGIQLQKSTQKIFAVEVAFHENGLDYGGSKQDTIVKVLSKCIRIAMCLRACFPKPKIEIYFASPVIKETRDQSFLARLINCFKILNKNSSNIGKDITFTLLANDDFNNRIVKPLLIRNDSIADTSELFIRSCQLLNVVGTSFDTKLTSDFLNEIEPISDIVKNYMVPILKKMKAKDITELTKTGMFGTKGWATLAKERDPQRHYKDPINIDGVDYYLSNHWTNQNKKALIQWIIDHSIRSKRKK